MFSSLSGWRADNRSNNVYIETIFARRSSIAIQVTYSCAYQYYRGGL